MDMEDLVEDTMEFISKSDQLKLEYVEDLYKQNIGHINEETVEKLLDVFFAHVHGRQLDDNSDKEIIDELFECLYPEIEQKVVDESLELYGYGGREDD